MATLFKRNGKGSWVVMWFGHDGRRCTKSTRTSDKRAAEQLASKLEADAMLRRNGVIDVRIESVAQHGRRPIAEHLADFERSLVAKNATASHVAMTVTRARRVIEGCGFPTWGEFSASAVMDFLRGLREDKVDRDPVTNAEVRRKAGISAQTSNFYLQAVKQFGRWMVKDRRATESVLSHLDGLNVRTDRRHDRRALSADELRKLIKHTETASERFGMSGADRALLYTLAVETGLRAGELRSLTRRSFDLDATPPAVKVAAGYSKRRRDDTLPLRAALAESLKKHLANKTPSAPAFQMPAAQHQARMIRADLEGAGIAFKDVNGHVADFHALRHTFISNLAAGGIHPKMAQTLARHSTITLTMNRYTHVYAGDEALALEVLPDLSLPATDQQARATGTNDKTPAVIGAAVGAPKAESFEQLEGDSTLGISTPDALCTTYVEGAALAQQLGDETTPDSTALCDDHSPDQIDSKTPTNEKHADFPVKNTAPQISAGRCDETERAGFEPAIRANSPYNGLANRRLQPLGHLSFWAGKGKNTVFSLAFQAVAPSRD